jgi:predicted RND superfamily exporter protein
LAISFLLLALVFRSVVVPLKAVILNLLSVGAAYGVIVAVFQWGWGAGLLGTAAAPIAPWIPVMVFAIVFGLSMDYEVFLLSAIRETWEIGRDPRAAVVAGLRSTSRLITAAAAIMILVFGSFVTSNVQSLKVLGLGLAVAIALDATIIRMILVPALMTLLGPASWTWRGCRCVGRCPTGRTGRWAPGVSWITWAPSTPRRVAGRTSARIPTWACRRSPGWWQARSYIATAWARSSRSARGSSTL